MDAALTSRMSESHARRLAWFEERQGDVTGLPDPLPGDLRLVSAPKGIYKPGDLPYALSIRTNLGSSYRDGQVLPRPDGGWRLSYHQEGADPAQRDRMFTNRGLMRCIDERIPVGVLRARERAGRGSRYDVLGLAVPVGWYDGYFLFESLGPDGAMPVADTLKEILEATAQEDTEQDGQDAPVPADDYDARLRTLRQIVERRGQQAFRAALVNAYSGRCAVTECDVAAVLDAAHIRPYRGPESNVVPNGLLLRTDIHALLDLQLLAIDPKTRQVAVARELTGTQYEPLAGTPVAEPAAVGQRPSQAALDTLWREFQRAEAARSPDLTSPQPGADGSAP